MRRFEAGSAPAVELLAAPPLPADEPGTARALGAAMVLIEREAAEQRPDAALLASEGGIALAAALALTKLEIPIARLRGDDPATDPETRLAERLCDLVVDEDDPDGAVRALTGWLLECAR